MAGRRAGKKTQGNRNLESGVLHSWKRAGGGQEDQEPAFPAPAAWEGERTVLAFWRLMSHLREMRHSHWTIQGYQGCSQNINKCHFVEQRFCCELGGRKIRWHLIRHKHLLGPQARSGPLPRSYPLGSEDTQGLPLVRSLGTSFQNIPQEAATSHPRA